ncbi:MAG: hypothetical protein AAFZ99_11310 [Pseudomonadota bacterium]
MTRLCFDGRKWSPDLTVFGARNHRFGKLAERGAKAFGGSSAYTFIGPDVMRPCVASHRSAAGHRAAGHLPGFRMGGARGLPENTFPVPEQAQRAFGETEAATQNTIRGGASGGAATPTPTPAPCVAGHLISGQMGGGHGMPANIFPITQQAHAQMQGIENRVRIITGMCRTFDRTNNGEIPHWYGVRYWVQTSDQALASDGDAENPHNHAPRAIKITWRLMRVTKPVGASGTTLTAHLSAAAGHLSTPPVHVVTPASAADVAVDLPPPPPAPAPSGAATPALSAHDPAYDPPMPNQTPQFIGASIPSIYLPPPSGAPLVGPAQSGYDGEAVVSL